MDTGRISAAIKRKVIELVEKGRNGGIVGALKGACQWGGVSEMGLAMATAEAALRAPSKNLSQLRLPTVAAVAFIALVVCVCLPFAFSLHNFFSHFLYFLFFFFLLLLPALSFQKHCPTNI